MYPHLSPKDQHQTPLPIRDEDTDIMGVHRNKVVEHVLLVPKGIHVSVLANLRLGAMTEEEFEGALKQPELFEKIRNINQPLSLENEFRVCPPPQRTPLSSTPKNKSVFKKWV